VAVDLAKGTKLWEATLGDAANMDPRLKTLFAQPSGLPNLGGGIVTAGGLVFIGATFDPVFRAFDIETGKQLWQGALPAGARATPMTYMLNGRQFVVIAAGGNEDWGKGDSIVAFALPKQ